MWNPKNRSRRMLGRKPIARKPIARRAIPLVEAFEPRIVLSGTGFLQGTVFADANANNKYDPANGDTPVSNALVQLIQGNAVVQYTYTNSDGSYAFTGIIPGTYQVTETPPSGYANAGTQVNSPLNPVTATTSSTITVQVEDLSNLAVTYNAPLEYASLEPGVVTYDALPVGGTTPQSVSSTIGQLPISVALPGGSTVSFASDCVDIFSNLAYGVDTFTGSGEPLGSTLVPNTNAGAIGYLYNTYSGLAAQTPTDLNQAYNFQALQLAIWKLEYDTGADLLTFSSGNIENLSIDTDYDGYESVQNDSLSNLESRAIAYIQEGLKYSEPGVEILAISGPNGYQDVLAPGSLNFSNLPTAGVSTAIDNAATNQPIGGNQPLGTSVYDTATVAGTAGTPTGTLTYDFYDTASPVYGTTTPVSTETVTLNSDGSVPASSATVALPAGSYSFIGVYSGDSHYAMSVGDVEPLTINQGSSGVSTVVYDAATNQPIAGDLSPGESVYDTATVTGTPFTPTGTVTYYFYNTATPVFGTTVPVDSTTVTLTVAGTVPASATEGPLGAGGDAFIAVYSGDANYAGYTGAAEPIKVDQAGPSLTTTPGGPVTLGGITISGTKFLDLTGDGFSSDDAPQNGVTIDLYQPTKGGGKTLVASTTTANGGTYSFSVTTPGTYFVQESVPSGYVQTGGGPNGGAGNAYYTINAAGGTSYSGYDFDDFAIPDCNTCGASNFTYEVATPNGHGGYSTPQKVSDFSGKTAQGDQVSVILPRNSTSTYTLVVYTAPTPYFSDSNAYQQVIYQQVSGSYSTAPGHTLTVTIPNTYYQLDFICGSAIGQLEPNQCNDAYGPDSGEILYHAQHRYIDGDNGGKTCPNPLPSQTDPATPPNPTSTPSTVQGLTDTATLTGAYNPTGTITFTLYAPGGSKAYTDTVTVNGNGPYSSGSYVPATTGTYQWVATYSGDQNNGGANDQGGASEQELVSPPLSLTGTVYCDMNVDGKFDSCDQGVAEVTVTLSGTSATGAPVSLTTTTNAGGVYTFTGMPLGDASGYTVTVTTPSGDFAGWATVGSLGGTAQSSPESVTSIVMSNAGQATGTGYNFGLMEPSSLSGQVIDDGKNDCRQDSCDQGLVNVTVTLTGTDYLGHSVTATTKTDTCGDYSFNGLAPGTYTVTVSPPNGFGADADWAGTVNGSTDGSTSSRSTICSIKLDGCGDDAINYVFSLIGSCSSKTQTQSCSYWCGSQGQSLINCLDGGSNCTDLGNWLAETCPNLFGGLKGCTNSQVASYCKSWSNGNSNQKACAQVLSTALCAYVTNNNLGGSYGSSHGFSASDNGLGACTWNVGWYGSEIGLSNYQSYSINALLSQIDSHCSNGSIDYHAVNTVNSLCSNINGY